MNRKGCELIKGELSDVAPAGRSQGSRSNYVSFPLTHFVSKHGVPGRVFAAETGFKILSDPDVVVAPDVAFVLNHRPPTSRDGIFREPPILPSR